MGARVGQARAAQATLQSQLAAQESAVGLLRAETAAAVQSARTREAAPEAEMRRAEAAHEQERRDHAQATDLSSQGLIGPQAMVRAALVLRQVDEQRDDLFTSGDPIGHFRAPADRREQK